MWTQHNLVAQKIFAETLHLNAPRR